ncbi:MAG: PhzF family phenazine biosynthesis protein [Gammaproteobacteria bacterium]
MNHTSDKTLPNHDSIPLYQVDAFTDRLFAGNPAAVCLLTSWLPDSTLQQIAAENNLSETAFLVPQGDDYHIRWFTPLVEVKLCGHATLASGFVILNYLQPERQVITFHSLSGKLIVRRQDDKLQMQFPCLTPDPVSYSFISEILGVEPEAVYKAENYLAILNSEQQIRNLILNIDAFRCLEGASGLIVSAPGDKVDFVSRYFTKRLRTLEDPVTGSAHCTLTPYWAERLHKTALHAKQLSERGGELWCELRDNSVYISGKAVLYLQGKIAVK